MTYTQIFPILSTADLGRLADFYVTAVDARVSYRFPPDGAPSYVSLDLAAGRLGVASDGAAPGPDAGQRTALWLYVDECDAAFGRLVDAGAAAVAEPADMPWGERVAQVRDPDGNVLHLGEPPADG